MAIRSTLNASFSAMSCRTAKLVGKPGSFIAALLLVIVWGTTGPLFHFNDAWQLVINTGTTIVTFLMVFLIQHAQNRDSEAIQIKLDELIRALDTASNKFINIESLDEDAIERLKSELQKVRESRTRKSVRSQS